MLHSLSLPWVICARWACCEGKEEEGRRRKEESDVPPVRVCVGIPRQHPRSSQMRPSVPPPTLERALRSSAGKGLQTRTGTRHRTTTPTAQRHSPLPLLSSSPPLSRTHQTRTNTHQPQETTPTQPRTSLPKGPDWPMGRKGRRSEKDPVSRAPNASLPDQGRVGGVGEHPGGAGRQLPGRGWSAPPGGRYPVPYIYPNSTLT